jgi:NADPH2:quinone reductase
MKAIQVRARGGPEQLRLADLPVPEPGPHQARVRVHAIGVNFIDVYYRTGLYPAQLPLVPGMEGAGTVDAVGAGVAEARVGDRVAWAGQMGSYAEYVLVDAWRLVPIPSNLDDRSAAALMLQGMTAHYLSHSTYRIEDGDWVLIHAGAGGVGLLLTQMAKSLGARVITTVSTDEKARLSREAGADHVVLYTQSDFAAETRRLTDGEGVAAVYDSVGKTTFDKSLDSLRVRGYMVLFGSSSGPVPPVDTQTLNAKGSLFLTRPTLRDYTRTRDELLSRAGAVMAAVASGTLKLRIEHTFALDEAERAHRELESRATTGKLLLIPS